MTNPYDKVTTSGLPATSEQTPRTEKRVMKIRLADGEFSTYVVPDFARQLERELSTAKAQIAAANKALALENEISAFMSDSTISFKEWLKRNAALLQARDEELAEKDAQIATLEAKRREDVRKIVRIVANSSFRDETLSAIYEAFQEDFPNER